MPNDPKSTMPYLSGLMAEHNISVRSLARALSTNKQTVQRALRGEATLELIDDIATIIAAEGFAIPENLWVNSEGEDVRLLKRRQLRRLSDSRVISIQGGIPTPGKRRITDRYISPDQLDPRKDQTMQPLTLTARRRFGLDHDPFRAELRQVSDVLETPEHEAAVKEMLNASTRQDFICITGEVGCGKSTCKEVFFSRLPRNVHIIQLHTLNKAEITGSNIYDAIILDLAGELDTKTTIPTARERKARKVIELLQALVKEGRTACLLIEEAQGLSKECFRALKRLHELSSGFEHLLSIILIAQREILPRLNDPTLREVGQRVARFEFTGLNGRTGKYLEHKISRAGGNFNEIFDAAAVKEIEKVCTRTEGKRKFGPYPLQLNALCTMALNVADELDEPRITVAVIDEIKPSQERR